MGCEKKNTVNQLMLRLRHDYLLPRFHRFHPVLVHLVFEVSPLYHGPSLVSSQYEVFSPVHVRTSMVQRFRTWLGLRARFLFLIA